MAAPRISAESALDEMTECSICTEVFTDPRGLPCIHTFCLKCLLNYGKDRQPGDTMPCPLCRKEFTIPDDGLAGLQKNFFMEQLLYVRKLSDGKEAQHIPCDACSPIDGASAKPATMHCVQCQENYCDQCSQSHARMKATADHIHVKIGKPPKKEEIAMKMPPAACDVHTNKQIEVYCLECKLAVCVMCFIKSHQSHKCCDIKEVSDGLRSQVMTDTDKVTEDLKNIGELLTGFDKEKKDLISQLAEVEREINKTADKLIDAIQSDRKKLLSEVESISKKRTKQLETVKEELERHTAALESFKQCSETLLSCGTVCDVVRSAKSLHNRADELAITTGQVAASLPRIIVKLTSSTVLGERESLVGRIIEDEKSAAPTVTHVIPRGNNVGGVTSLGDDIFVVRHDSQHVEVYNAVSFTLRRRLMVPELGPIPSGLAVCAVNKCLYASDWDSDSVHRVELSGSNAVTEWSVARYPNGVSVNSSENVLVVSQYDSELQEFTTRGLLVREIQLQYDIQYPLYSVQLSADKFLVSHYGSHKHRVCLVDANGDVVRSFGGQQGSNLTRMTIPMGMAMDKHGNVLVADKGNNRLLVLDQSLSSSHEMSVSVDGGLQEPRNLCYDESRRRLYIGERDGGRIIVIDNLKDFSANRV